MYVSRKKGGGRKLDSIGDCLDASEKELENYIKINKERLMTASNNNSGNVSTDTKTMKINKHKRKKNNWVDISSNKLARLNMGRYGKGNLNWETESLF